MGRSILLWLLGVPIPIIILIALFSHHWRSVAWGRQSIFRRIR